MSDASWVIARLDDHTVSAHRTDTALSRRDGLSNGYYPTRLEALEAALEGFVEEREGLARGIARLRRQISREKRKGKADPARPTTGET